MASKADGSIHIDTELDSSGFDKGSDKLIGAIKELEASVNAIGSNLSQGLDAVVRSLQSMSSQASSANQQVAQTAQSAQQAASEYRQVAESADAAASATQRMGAAPKQAASEYSSINRAAASLSDQLTRLSTAAEVGFKSDGQVLRFRDNVDIASRKVAELRARLNALGSAKIPTEDYAFLQSEIDKTDKALQRYLDRQDRMRSTGVRANSAAYERLQYDIANAQRALDAMNAEMRSMEANGEAFTLGSDTSEYQNMAGVLGQLEGKLAGVKSASSQAQQSMSGMAQTHPILASLGAAAECAGNSFLSMGKSMGKAALGAMQSAVKKLGSGLKAVASGAKKAISGLLGFNRTAKAGVSPVNSLLKGLTSLKTMLLTRIKSTFISYITNQLSEGIEAFASYSSEFNKAVSNIRNTGTQLAGNLTTLFANIVTVIEPALTRLLELVNSVVTALSALFAKFTGQSTVAVASKGTEDYAASLSDAAGSASDAADEQKAYNAELYGWDELTKQSDQSDSSSSSGTSSDSGITWTDMPVDDVLSDWEDIDFFQTGYDLAEKLADALDSIPWDAIQAAAYGIGQHLAELLNGVFANLHLADSLGNTIAQALNTGLSFALGFLETFNFSQFGVWAGTLWNAIVDNFNFDMLASVITLGGNGIIDALTSFFTTISSTCGTLGAGLADVWNAIFVGIDFSAAADMVLLGVNDLNLALEGFNNNVDWAGTAQNIVDGANTLIRGMVLDENGELTNVWAENGTQAGKLLGGFVDSIHTFFAELDYSALGENIGLWLYNAFNGIDWYNLFDIVVQQFNGLVTLLNSTIVAIDWYDVGGTLLSSLVDAVMNIDWSSIGTTISNFFSGALDLLVGAVWETDWVGLGESLLRGLIDMIVGINWAELISKLFILLCSVIVGAVELLGGAIAGLFEGLWDALCSIGNWLINGLFQGICDTLSSIGSWLKEHIVDPIVNGIKSLFGINSPSTVFAEIGDFLIQGLLGGLSDAWGSITSFFSDSLENVKSTITGAWESVKEKTSEAWGNIKSSISESWTNIKSTASQAATNVKTNVTTEWNNLKSNTSSAYANIKSTIQSKFNSAKSAVSTAVSNMKSTATSGWTNMVSNAKTKFKDIYDTCKSKMSDAEGYLSGIEWGSIGTDLINGLLKGLKSAWEGVTSWISSATTGLTSKVKSILGIASPSKVWAQIGVYLDEGLVQGLESGEDEMLSTAAGLAESLTDRMSDTESSLEVTDDGDVTRLGIIADKLSGIAAIIERISDALASMGGLQIPQIAAGTVVPYKTQQTAAAGSSDTAYAGTDTRIDQILEAVRQMLEYMRAGGTQSSDVKVVINGREVFQAVVEENERAILRNGSSPIRV